MFKVLPVLPHVVLSTVQMPLIISVVFLIVFNIAISQVIIFSYTFLKFYLPRVQGLACVATCGS